MQSIFNYKNNDMFYTVKSYLNFFLVVQLSPKKKQLILSFIDDNSFMKQDNSFELIRKSIKALSKNSTDYEIKFENLTSIQPQYEKTSDEILTTASEFVRRWGATCKENYLNNYDSSKDFQNKNQRLNNGYYPVKETDVEYDEEQDGLFLSYNALNYGLTILSKYIETLPTKLLNITTKGNKMPNTVEDVRALFIKNSLSSKDVAINISARKLKKIHDDLYSEAFIENMSSYLKVDSKGKFLKDKTAQYIYDGWLLTGRHIDIAKLNENQSNVGLNKLIGFTGESIEESEKLRGNTTLYELEDVCEVCSYAVKEALSMKKLFEHEKYQTTFENKKQLLKDYKQTIYQEKEQTYTPDVSPNKVDVKRLTINSTASKIASKIIAPYHKLVDKPCVSYMYPSPKVAKKLGIKPVDVLEESRKWAIENIPNGEKAFEPIYRYYDFIRGKNSNEEISNMIYDRLENKYINQNDIPYKTLHNETLTDIQQKNSLSLLGNGFKNTNKRYIPMNQSNFISPLDKNDLKNFNTNWFYRTKNIDENGNAKWSSCFITFSIGGAHGQEINQQLFQNKYIETISKHNALEEAKKHYQNNAHTAYFDTHKSFYIWTAKEDSETTFDWKEIHGKDLCKSNPIQWNEDFNKSNAIPSNTMSADKYKETLNAHENLIEDILFVKKGDTGYKLRDTYKYVSVGHASHADFRSYYPHLAIMLGMFENEKMGFDPYEQIKNLRLQLQKEKEQLLPNDKRYDELDSKQKSLKHIINAPTGEADSNFANSNIRMNNNALSMRIIGQLFAWRIGQAQTLAGAKVPSTNTDGLYTLNISLQQNKKILEDVIKPMLIEVEPEMIPLFITKDSNNRIECDDQGISSASGNTLSSYKGASPSRSCPHPPLVDYLLANYLVTYENATEKEFNKQVVIDLFNQLLEKEALTDVLKRCSWIVSSSIKAKRYNFLVKAKRNEDKSVDVYYENDSITPLHAHSRIFLVKETNDYFNVIQSTEKRNTANQRKKHFKDQQVANYVLKLNADKLKSTTEEIALKKITKMPQNQAVLVENRSLYELSEQKQHELFKQLDLNAYFTMVQQFFESSWKNN